MKQNKFIMLFLFISVAIFILIKYNFIDNSSIAVYLDNIESASIPDRNSNYIIDKIVCDNDAAGTWDNVNWSLLVTNLSKKSNCKLYFRSKKDVTVIYDNNYVKNNIFYDTYVATWFNSNVITSSKTKYTISDYNDSKYYVFSSGSDETAVDMAAGFFNYPKNEKLTPGNTYTLQFEAKGNTDFIAYINSEQNDLYNKARHIATVWQKYTDTFVASSSNYYAFSIYGWLNGAESRILEVRNLSLQEGEYDNYSKVTLKEYDSLGNLPTPTRDNYTFLGWYTHPIDGDKISSSTVVTDNVTYYSHWQYNG